MYVRRHLLKDPVVIIIFPFALGQKTSSNKYGRDSPLYYIEDIFFGKKYIPVNTKQIYNNVTLMGDRSFYNYRARRFSKLHDPKINNQDFCLEIMFM